MQNPKLASAFALFLDELDKHMAFFAQVSAELHSLAADSQKPNPNEVNHVEILKERFHLIRGGASFLGLTAIKDHCQAAEEMLTQEPSYPEILRAINGITAQFETILEQEKD